MRCLHCRNDGISVSAEICPQCGVYLPSLLRDVLPMGTQLRGGSYRIDYALGRGGFGITYRAIDLGLEMLVAIKEFYPQEHAIRNGMTGGLSVAAPQRDAYKRGLERFQREGRILARLNHHNVVRVLSLFEERDTAYLVMELIAGKTLRDELESQPSKRLSPARIDAVMYQLVEALDAVHNAGIYHLDLKPENVLLMPDGKVVLVDFGAARQGFSNHSTRTYTLSYAAPEAIAGDEVGAQSDIFELGMMLHEMVTGELPPPALSRLIKDNWKVTNLGQPWQSLVRDALYIPRENRPNSVRKWWESGKANPPQSPHSRREDFEEFPPSPLRGGAGGGVPPKPKVKLESAVGMDYTRLQSLLAAGKWKEADEETARVMLKVAKREKEGWLLGDSIENFPCPDLRTIDHLWVQYSGGRFGFSVQKRIWIECGGQPGKGDNEIFCMLGNLVGWRVGVKKWINYREMKFSLDAPPGHLPIGVWVGGGVGWGFGWDGFSSLAIRLVNCSI